VHTYMHTSLNINSLTKTICGSQFILFHFPSLVLFPTQAQTMWIKTSRSPNFTLPTSNPSVKFSFLQEFPSFGVWSSIVSEVGRSGQQHTL
jgi:hypothetical protein